MPIVLPYEPFPSLGDSRKEAKVEDQEADIVGNTDTWGADDDEAYGSVPIIEEPVPREDPTPMEGVPNPGDNPVGHV